MSEAETIFEFASEEVKSLGAELPQFDLFNSCDPMSSLLRLQCKSEIIFDEESGLQVNEEDFVDRCRAALVITKMENPNIFLTPEYSFPLALIPEIVTNTAYQPEKGKLWCLGCQADTHNSFEEKLNQWEKLGAVVSKAAIRNCNRKKWVSSLLYIFKLSDERICILPQLKVKPMADREYSHEGLSLTCGKKIFLISDNTNTKWLCSLICADVLYREKITMSTLLTGRTNMILLHPQLNTKPREYSFAQLREEIYRDGAGRECIYITANWAAGTQIKDKDGKPLETITTPWSCIYIKNAKKIDEWCKDNAECCISNLNLGIGYVYWHRVKVNIWYASQKDCLQLIHIKKSYHHGPEVCTVQKDLQTVKFYEYERCSDQWQATSNCFKDNLALLLPNISGTPYEYPLKATLKQRDDFFAVCLGESATGQITTKRTEQYDEICGRLGLYIDDDCDEIRKDMARRYLTLVDCLQKEELPKRFGNLRNNHILGLQSGSMHNLTPTDSSTRKKAIVAYVSIKEAEKLVEEWKRLLRPEEYVDMCVFSVNLTRVVCFPEINVEFDAPDNVSKEICFTEG